MENKIDNNKNKKIIIVGILVLFLLLIGGTYAYMVYSATISNGNYNTKTTCFNINYDTGADIAGTLFPSSGPSGGIAGGVSLIVDSSCSLNGIGDLYLDINSVGDTLIQTVSEHCENSATLMTLSNYTNSTDCTDNGGIWVDAGTALKYAVYNTSGVSNETVPLNVGYITGVGSINIYSGFDITATRSSYYIHVWLDGNISDDTYANMSFDGKISASAVQVS